MRETTLRQIADWCGGTVSDGGEAVVVNGFATDTRELQPGQLFFALAGAHDGHDYVAMAKERGAAAAVCSRPVDCDLPLVLVEDTRSALCQAAAAYKETLSCRTVAITGSVGKTSTRSMTMCLLEKKYVTYGTKRNYNNDIGLPLTIGGLEADCEMAVLELGMNHFGEMSRLTAIAKPDTVVITNIGSMHIENLGSREGILKAKLEILEGLKEDGRALFNGDEPLLWNLRAQQKCETLYFGLDNPDCDIRATNVELSENGSRFRLCWQEYDLDITLHVRGIHNVYNAVAASAVAMIYGVPAEDIQRAMAAFETAEQRQQTYQFEGYTIIDDTYNAGPESMEAALQVLGDTKTEGKRIAVLGDMLELGNHASSEHYRIGRVAAYKADLVLTFGPESVSTVSGAITGGVSPRNAQNFETQEELLNTLRSRAKRGDTILFKGSHGMHMENVLSAFTKQDQ